MPKKSYKLTIGNGGRSDKLERNSIRARFEDLRVASSSNTTNNGGSNYSGNRPRVSFKNQSRPIDKRNIPKRLERIISSQFDDDVTMSSGPSNNPRQMFRDRNRFSLIGGRQSRRGSRLPTHQRPHPTVLYESNWYRIQIMFGSKWEKDFIINTLLSHIAPITFIPIMYKIIGQDATFFVDDSDAAQKLLTSDRRITTSDGFKLIIKVRPGFPPEEVDDALKEKMKLAMAKRYVAETNALDLSHFHLDPELVQEHFCALSKPSIMMSVLNIVSEAIPNLNALNLSSNKLSILERLNVLSKKFSNLKILYLCDNKIKEINQIDVLKDLNLEELQLNGNPVCNRYRKRPEDYISDVRKKFPKLLRLDGTELPKPILFDVADEGIKLPPAKVMFAGDPRAEKVAVTFMQQYFSIFDSDSRQPLLNAYHENAVFSLTISHSTHSHKFNKFLADNRNLFRITEPSRRRKLLKQGRLPVVSFISEMPKTLHDLTSFTMDISLVTDAMMLIIVTGCFKELDAKDQLIRFFNRTFIIVPEGTGYCIKNEQLHMAHPTASQEKRLQNNPPVSITSNAQPQSQQSGTAMADAPGPSTATIYPSNSVTGEPSVEIQQQMTLMLSQQTNMNLEWSLKCLKEVQWNYDTALAAFNDFYKRGEIPPAAFQK